MPSLNGAQADPVTYEDPEVVKELSLAHAVTSQRAAGAGEQWERLVAELDAVTTLTLRFAPTAH